MFSGTTNTIFYFLKIVVLRVLPSFKIPCNEWLKSPVSYCRTEQMTAHETHWALTWSTEEALPESDGTLPTEEMKSVGSCNAEELRDPD